MLHWVAIMLILNNFTKEKKNPQDWRLILLSFIQETEEESVVEKDALHVIVQHSPNTQAQSKNE